MNKTKRSKYPVVENGILKAYAETHQVMSLEGHIHQAFINAQARNVIIPQGVHTIGGLKTKEDGDHFTGDIFYHPFCHHDDVQTVTMLDDVKIIGEKAFEHCHQLKSIKMSTNITKILVNAFLYCQSLTEMDLYPTLTMIHSGAFVGCSNLKMIRFHGSYQQWQAIKIADDAMDEEMMVHTNDGVIYHQKPITFNSLVKDVQAYQSSMNKRLKGKKK